MTGEGTAQYYRDEARRIAKLAEETASPDIKAQLLEISRQFEKLAEHVVARRKRGR